jgi:N4-gp56 family major capsid protein
MSLTLITITPLFYGAWIGHTDEIEMTIYDPLISEVSAILGEQCGVSMDTLIRNDLTAGATKDYSGDQTARANLQAPQHNITYADFVKQVAELEAQSALPVDGEDFVVIVHPHTWASLNTDPIFVNMFIQESGQGNPMRSGYVGRILRCKVFVSGNAREYVDGGAGGSDVYSMLFIGREAYGYAGIAGTLPNLMVDGQPETGKPLTGQLVKPVEVIVKQLGSAGADDPLNQRATVGWKASLATSVLQANWLRDLEHTNIFSLD